MRDGMSENREIRSLSLPLDQIAAPAFFVDKKLSLCWTAPAGRDPFSQKLVRQLESSSTRNVFDILLRDEIKVAVPQWQDFFSFVYTLLKHSVSQDIFDTATIFVPRANVPVNHVNRSSPLEFGLFQAESRLLSNGFDPKHPPLRLFGLQFGAGTLFFLRNDAWQFLEKNDNGGEPAHTQQQQGDQKKIIAILSARLNDSHRIAETMLPELYLELTDHLWQETDDAVRSLGGKRVLFDGGEIQYRFTDCIGRNPVFSAICCATRFNGQMQKLAGKLAEKGGWVDEIRLNMGISHGNDDHEMTNTADPMELMIPGGASDQASVLSGISGKGEIWITKNAVTQLPKNLLNRVVLGINRNGRFFRNFFTRFSDLSPRVGQTVIKSDLVGLAIARIDKLERKGS